MVKNGMCGCVCWGALSVSAPAPVQCPEAGAAWPARCAWRQCQHSRQNKSNQA